MIPQEQGDFDFLVRPHTVNLVSPWSVNDDFKIFHYYVHCNMSFVVLHVSIRTENLYHLSLRLQILYHVGIKQLYNLNRYNRFKSVYLGR